MDESVVFFETDDIIVTIETALGEPMLVVREKGNLGEPYPLSHEDTVDLLIGYGMPFGL